MERVKSVALFTLIGAAIATVVSSFFAPKFIAWYNTPGDGVGDALCNPATIIGTTIDSFVRWQLIGAAVGAASGLLLGLIVVVAEAKRLKQRGVNDEPTDAAPPPAT